MDINVNWYEKYSNRPQFVIQDDLLDMGQWDDYIFTPKPIDNDCVLYYAEHPSGLVRYFLHNPHDEHGFGGDTINIKCIDGTTQTIKGRWSSRAGVLNKHGFGPCVDATINGYAASCTLTYIQHILQSRDIYVHCDKYDVDGVLDICKVFNLRGGSDVSLSSEQLSIRGGTSGNEYTYEPCIIRLEETVWIKP